MYLIHCLLTGRQQCTQTPGTNQPTWDTTKTNFSCPKQIYRAILIDTYSFRLTWPLPVAGDANGRNDWRRPNPKCNGQCYHSLCPGVCCECTMQRVTMKRYVCLQLFCKINIYLLIHFIVFLRRRDQTEPLHDKTQEKRIEISFNLLKHFGQWPFYRVSFGQTRWFRIA